MSEVIRLAAREHGDLVTAAAQGRPKAWGELAAHGVMAFRQRARRAPTIGERRAIWAGLWEHVEAARGRGAAEQP
ncbi:MAG: hypothetical protein M3O91_04005 [Chloroflexota bacterium]|nr:hypothetical protein [Chloroflexota bacterium]